MREIPITKYHGCGNDFLILRERDVAGMELEPLIVSACDRRTGIGADGFILVAEKPLEMKFYNEDGSRAPMCGNGIRCFARFCLDEGIVGGDAFSVRTGAGVKQVEVLSRTPFQARISMGKPDYDPAAVGVSSPHPLWDYELKIGEDTVKLCSFFLSTVHTVWLVDDAMDDRLLPLAEAIHRHPTFREKTNVNLVQVVDHSTIRMRTWERGVGLTLACGTGACASALTVYKKGLCGPHVTVELPRGQLYIDISVQEDIMMTGPACRTMKGVYCYDC